MKIYADMFKKWSKILESFQKKDDPFASKLYFDFNNKYIYFGSSDFGKGRMKFFFDLNTGEELPNNFFISTVDFLNVINQFDDITLTEGVFIHNNDKFKMSIIENEDDRIDISLFKDYNFSELPKNIFADIEKALVYINPADPNTNLHNVFIKNNYIYAYSSELPLYESKIDFNSELAVELGTANTILKIGNISEGCKLSQNASTAIIQSTDDELEVIIPNFYTTEFPDIRSDDFKSKYNFNTTLIVEREKFIVALQFIKLYLNVSNNGKFSITCGDDLLIKVEESSVNIEKHIPYISVSDELKGSEFELPGFKLESALKSLVGNNLTIKLPTDPTRSLVDLSCDDIRHTIIPRFAPK
jgi:hypothetical protein